MISNNYFIKAYRNTCLFLCAFLFISTNALLAADGDKEAAPPVEQCPGLDVKIVENQAISCNAGSNGVLEATVTGGDTSTVYSYEWSTGDTTATVSGLSAGTYSVTVTAEMSDLPSGGGQTSNAGCDEDGEDSYELMEPTALSADIAVDNHASQATNDNGSLTASGSGGTAPYTYAWSNSTSNQTATGLSADTYTVTVTDNNGCTATHMDTIIHLATISGYVWLDLDENGVFNEWEIGIEDMEVALFECDGDTPGDEVTTVDTGSGGAFSFMDILPGEYCVEIRPGEDFEGGFLGADYVVTTWDGTEVLTRTTSPSITVAPGELSELNLFGINYDACYPPFLVDATDCTEDGATLTWHTSNLSEHDEVDHHCWKIAVGGAGPQHAEFGLLGMFLDYLGAGLHAALVEVSICADDPDLLIEDGVDPGTKKLTYVLSDDLIQPGTAYWFAIAEICDDMPSTGNTSVWNFQRLFALSPSDIEPFDAGDDDPEYEWDGYEGFFRTKDDQFEIEVTGLKPTCPEESEGYEEDGCIEVKITDGTTCWSTYNISIDTVLMTWGDSEELQGDSINFGQGTYTFCGYGVGTYVVAVEEIDECNPPKSELIDDAVEVPNGMDMEAPTIIVSDFFAGGLVADNIEDTDADDSADLGDMEIPEGACSMKSYFAVTGVDNCDGDICVSDAISYYVEGPDNVNPGTQVNIYEDSEEIETNQGLVSVNACEFIVEINWAVGESTVTICLDDVEEADLSDTSCITITANVIDAADAVIVATPQNYVIPACADTVFGLFAFNIIDQCDNDIDPTQVSIEAFDLATDVEVELEFYDEPEDGYFEYLISITDDLGIVGEGGQFEAAFFIILYTDDFGNEYELLPNISVGKAAVETDPVIIASGDSFTALACEDGAEVVIGVTVTDDCDVITDELKISGVDGLSAAAPILNGLSAYFEFSGTLEPDEYSITFTYPGADDVTVAVVVAQEDNNAPAIDMPGNTTFTIPSCQDDVTAVWSVQISDDCDEEIDLDNVVIKVGDGIIDVPSANATVLSDGDGYVLIELNADLTLADDSAIFEVSYTDGEGEPTTATSTVTVNGTPDVIDPVIVYPTEPIVVELDPCGPSSTDVKFSVSAFDNCTDDLTVQVEALGNDGMSSEPSGTAAEKWTITYEADPDPYTIKLTATDNAGNKTEAYVYVSVTQAPKPPTNLACNTGLTAPVGSQCEVELTPDMVLEGTFGCLTPADIEIVVDGKTKGEPGANYTDGTGLHEFDIYIEGAYFCTGNITAYDNIPPVIDCPADNPADFICTDIDALLGSLVVGGEPSIFDNCEGATYDWYEEVLYGADASCDDATIKRVFTVTDGAGLTDQCTQYIRVRKPTLDDVEAPDEVVELSCDDNLAYDNNGHPSPTETGGFPYVETYFDDHNLDQTYCNLAATYEDSDLIDVCDHSYKFIRTWSVLDWCDTDARRTFTQLIKVGDTEAPTVTAPTVDYDWDGKLDVLEYSTGPFDCTASFQVPLPGVSDNCSDDWTITTEILAGGDLPILVIEDGDSRFVSGIPVGCHAFRYWVTDGCGNQTDITVPFFVADKVAPVAVCDDDLNISIGGQGYARVYADDIDEGSWDNCGPIRIEVRRLVTENENCNAITSYFSDWGDYVDFSCCDIGDAVRIELQVWDDANGDGIPGNSITIADCNGDDRVFSDNKNVCWLDVTVEDKLNPYCIAPHNKTVSCDELPYDWDPNDIEVLEDLFGEADYADNCPGASVAENAPVVTIDDCGTGTILRSFTATDAVGLVSGNTCQQLITITEVHNYEIRFPADSEADCGIADPDTISFNEIGCDLLAVSAEDEFFSASGDECYKIFRTYRVINWCEYDGEAPPVVVSRDEDCNGDPGDEAVWVLRRPNDAVFFDRDNDETNEDPVAGEKGQDCDGLTNPTGYWIDSYIDKDADRDPITGQEDNDFTNDNIRNIDSRGYWQYTQVIKVYDTVDPVITVEAYDDFESLDGVNCDGLVTINFTVEDECTEEEGLEYVWLDAFIVDADGDGNFTQAEFSADADVTAEVTGDAAGYTYAAELPQGQHALLIKATDGCGNESVDLIIFNVVDVKAPAPVCINGLAIELMPTEPGTDADGDGDEDGAAMAIWANDFIASPIYDCHGQGPEVDVNGNELVTAYSINLAGEEANRDSTGLVLTCDNDETTIVEIHAWDELGNHDFCETYILVQDNMGGCEGGDGAIAGNIETEAGEGIGNVEVQLSGNMSRTSVTVGDGFYRFADVQPGGDYSVTAFNNSNPLNGVSTFDLVLISKHILGVQELNSPFKILAADVNNNGAVSTLDLISARRLILGIDNSFPNNTSWRFFDANQTFDNLSNPWASDLREIISINNLPTQEVVADFVGIKVGDVNNNAIANEFMSLDERSRGSFAFNVEDVEMVAGNTYQVEFTAQDIASIEGYQGTFTFGEAIELVDITYGAVKEGNFGTTFVQEGLLTTSWNEEAKADDVLFTLVVRANSAAQLSEQLGLSSRITPSEAYNEDGDKLDLAINFSTGKVQEVAFELYQNQPNPFQGETVIGYNLPESAQVTFTVSDVAGRALKMIRTEGVKGYNNIILNSKDLPAAGVLYYTVSTDNYTATKKMIIQ
ncbi:MAG: T9SS type A sorting domain-containing protein [Saprospiraceae bacterium]|nr:T9SS type A sorting domain-containing protein [Saprospiraceae bacterium]